MRYVEMKVHSMVFEGELQAMSSECGQASENACSKEGGQVAANHWGGKGMHSHKLCAVSHAAGVQSGEE